MLSFLAVSLLVIVVPGPDTALTLRNAVLCGRGDGVATALGVVSGQICWATASAAGATTLLSSSHPLFDAVRIGGALYLVALGLQSVCRAVTGAGSTSAPPRSARKGVRRPRRAYRQGLISDLGNPKMAVFFTSVLPQVGPAVGGVFTTTIVLGVCFSALTMTWLVTFAVLTARVGEHACKTSVRRWFECAAGVAMVGFGTRLVRAVS